MDDTPDISEETNHPPSLTIDWEFYASYLDGSDLTDAQKQELIETIWSLVLACVDLRFDVRFADQACEQNDRNAADLSADLLELLEDNPNNQHQNPAGNALHSPAEKEES